MTTHRAEACVHDLRRVVRPQSDGTFDLDLDYFVHHAAGTSMTWYAGGPVLGTLFSDQFVNVFGSPRVERVASPPIRGGIERRYLDVAASLQAMLEEAQFGLVRMLAQRTGQSALCMAGGVALNSVFNGKILSCTPFHEVFIQPAAGDAATSLGVAYYSYQQLLGHPRRSVVLAKAAPSNLRVGLGKGLMERLWPGAGPCGPTRRTTGSGTMRVFTPPLREDPSWPPPASPPLWMIRSPCPSPVWTDCM